MAGAGKLTTAGCNFVHLDESWKTYVHKEGYMSRRWDKNWGFLCQEYQQLRQDIDKACGIPPRRSAAFSSSPSPSLLLPPLPSPPQDTRLTFPTTTSREVGWLSSQRGQLEVFGRWGRPKVSILHHLNWPYDAVE